MRCRLWNAFTRVFWTAASAEYQGFHTSTEETRKYAHSYAEGAYFSKIRLAFGRLASMATLEKASFVLVLEGSEMRSQARNRDSLLYKNQSRLAAMGFNIVFASMRWRSLTHMHYTSSIPGRFMGLLPGFNNENALQYTRKAWECMCKFEVDRHVFKECATLWESVPFLENEVVREILIMLSEFDFRFIPPHVVAHVQTLTSFTSSLATELGNREVRMRILEGHNNKLIEQTMWLSLIQGSVFQDMGRETLPPTEELFVEPFERMSKSCYTALGGVATLASEDDPKLDAIKNPAGKTWTPLSAISKNFVPAAWSLMMNITEEPSLRASLPMAWMALFAVKGDVITQKSTSNTFMVMEVSKFGFLGFPCKLEKVKHCRGPRVVLFEATSVWTPLVDPEDWEARPLFQEPPVYELAWKRRPSIAVEASPTPMKLLERCVRVGCKDVPVSYIDRLYRREVAMKHPELSKPRLFIQRLILLIKHLAPGITAEDIDLALGARLEEVKDAPRIDANGELAEALLDPSERKEVRKAAEEHKSEVERRKKAEDDIKIGSKYLETLGYDLKKKAAPKPAPPVDLIAVEWAKIAEKPSESQLNKLIPKVPGCRLGHIPKKSCFTAFYAGALPHASRTRTWGRSFSKQAVLKHCVRWAWTEHQKAGGAPCPFKI